ncbi:acetolactate synthase large subunit [Streptomyces scabiei]|uniref:Putative acetolactate synthase large subunit IlvX n=1 Tax=Streptomyces scabiei TaxID=1930 RepID=A0A117EBQ8_STRSC|nr:acetolactate synthase large subunit [Streptomyces scabiei]GAQ59795.1 putative acetolactate synthase large subunit IlvX [Streptomyces scabiei]
MTHATTVWQANRSGGMTGAEALVETALAAGVDVCFANPGTTEMPLVAALDSVPGTRAVLGLFEGVCTGAADGYARIAGRPAMTLLHLGPGFANGIANLHNARRAHSPVLNVVGDHASWHLSHDAPLTSDIVSLATPVSGWVGTAASGADLARLTADAVAAATTAPGCGATLIAPADFQQTVLTAPVDVHLPGPRRRREAAADVIDPIAGRLRAGTRAVLLLGGTALSRRGQRAAARIAAATGATLYSETFPAAAERGAGLPDLDRLPYFPEKAMDALADAQLVLLAGASEPVAYFGYEGIPSRPAPAGTVEVLSTPEEDSALALEHLADALGAPEPAARPRTHDEGLPKGALTPGSVGLILSALLPERAVVSVEGGTCGYPFFTASSRAARHTTLTNTGGAIGQGLPAAVGAALAAPDRRVVALQSDGSAQYTVQSLWTMAREQLPVVTLIASNRAYNVLRTELGRHGQSRPGPVATALTSLDGPAFDWPALARGYGVPGTRVETGEALRRELGRALAADGPRLIEMAL